MTKMYEQRKGNISVFRGCSYFCTFCAFRTSLRRSPCEKCRAFEPHAHMEVLDRTPPKTKNGEFITIGLTGDISFMDVADFYHVMEYCRKWKDRTFLIQSKNPACFLRFREHISPLRFPDNVILGTTTETNRIEKYDTISKAPSPVQRFEAMLKITSKIFITIEPILDFDMGIFTNWIKILSPNFCYIGYDSHPKRNKLPEPSLNKTHALIVDLRAAGIEIREKIMRKAWWEK